MTQIWILYYKGTGLEMPFNNPNMVIRHAENTIAEGLKMGISLETQKRRTLEDLNEMEEFLSKTFMNNGWCGEDLKRIIGDEDFARFCTKWLINVVCGLKLKLIKNDEMNGHQYINF